VFDATKRHYRRWIDKRLPPARKITLTQKQIFILPSRVGAGFLAVLALMLLLAINYENSLIYALTFLLGAFFIVCILHTFNNLSGLTVSSVDTRPCIAGDQAEVELLLSREGHKRFENVVLKWGGGAPETGDLIDAKEVHIKLYLQTHRRGWMCPGRLLVETHYPAGLLRAWTWLDMDTSLLVYPKPIAVGKPSTSILSAHDGELLAAQGAEDFTGLSDYHPGVSLRHVAWKHYARERGLLVKEYSAYVERRTWIDWDAYPGLDCEDRLSRMCYRVLEVAKSADEFGVRLPGTTIEPGRGEAHRRRALTALALFDAAG